MSVPVCIDMSDANILRSGPSINDDSICIAAIGDGWSAIVTMTTEQWSETVSSVMDKSEIYWEK